MNETRKKKKNVKGVTLVEVIISLAVVAVLTVLLVATATTINAYIKSANHVNQKTSVQAPIAESKYVGSAHELSDSTKDITITVNNKVKLNGKGYSVIDPSLPKEAGVGGDLNMKFVVVNAVEPPDET